MSEILDVVTGGSERRRASGAGRRMLLRPGRPDGAAHIMSDRRHPYKDPAAQPSGRSAGGAVIFSPSPDSGMAGISAGFGNADSGMSASFSLRSFTSSSEYPFGLPSSPNSNRPQYTRLTGL